MTDTTTSFREFLELQEALITFGKKAYPKFGNIVILAGGAGSGKGFILKNLIGIEGKVLDVDATKERAMNSVDLARRIKKEYGVDITKMNLKNSDNVSKLHVMLKKVIDNKDSAFFTAVKTAASPDRLPNIIFDVTLKDWKKFEEITKTAELMGYQKKNIHLVWVVNSMQVAMTQNKERDRVVPEKILVQTHVGAAKTFKDIISEGDRIARFINGDIWLAFNNKARGDVKYKKSAKGKGGYIEKASKFKLKSAGQNSVSAVPQKAIDQILADTGNQF